MARLLACPSCRRHVRAWERDCPFCGHVGLTTSAPARLSTLLLGLSLVGCTSPNDSPNDSPKDEATKKQDEQEADAKTPEPEPAPTTAAPQPVPEPPPEPASTTAIEPPPLEGTDAGDKIEDPKPEVDVAQKPKLKYGAPRPQKKYGAPPKPDDPRF